MLAKLRSWREAVVLNDRVQLLASVVLFVVSVLGPLWLFDVGFMHLPDSGGLRVKALASMSLEQLLGVVVGLVCMGSFLSALLAGLALRVLDDCGRIMKRTGVTRNEKSVRSWREMLTFVTESQLTFCAIAYRDLQDVGERAVWKARALGAVCVWSDTMGGEASFDDMQRMEGLFDTLVADDETRDESCQVGALEPA
ncbi:hypothetical protein [Paraburkholderia sp.]|uniref:hypothetical protein n=1 Tax=Paraburkholderia sp. TaxID=1926495 RepID=UPI003D6F2249